MVLMPLGRWDTSGEVGVENLDPVSRKACPKSRSFRRGGFLETLFHLFRDDYTYNYYSSDDYDSGRNYRPAALLATAFPFDLMSWKMNLIAAGAAGLKLLWSQFPSYWT